MANENILEIKDLCVSVEGRELLHNINLSIPAGEVHALLGQNGSGKTSLIMVIMGFSKYEVTNGQIIFEGRDITDLGITERAKLGIGIAQQRPPSLPGVALRSVAEYILKDKTNKKEEINELAGATRVKAFLDRGINEGLSGGEIRRAELMQLMAQNPVFSMLDEPDSGLDMESIAPLGRLINSLFSPDPEHPVKRRAGLIITHNGDILNYMNVDKAHIMIDGNLCCSGNPAIILDTVSKSGFEECASCMRERQ